MAGVWREGGEGGEKECLQLSKCLKHSLGMSQHCSGTHWKDYDQKDRGTDFWGAHRESFLTPRDPQRVFKKLILRILSLFILTFSELVFGFRFVF
jgi:hypothetical protein